MTTHLSPAAQAVWDAWNDAYEAQGPLEDMGQPLGAALRAIEDQLAQDRADPLPPDLERAVLTERIKLFRRITAIAAELEGSNG